MKIKKKKENSSFLPYILEYKKIVENKFYEKCKGFIDFIYENVIKNDNFKKYDGEGKIFFYKQMGDYNNYISETETFKDNKNIASKYYNESLKMANNLPIYNPVKLGLILNMTVFYYDIINDKKKAIEMAKSTIEKFKKESQGLEEDAEETKDAFSLFNLIEENLAMWKVDDE